MKMIPFTNLKIQYEKIKNEINEAVLHCLASSEYILGPQVSLFEKNFSKYCGTSHAIAVNSGTSALHLALLSLGIGSDDEVITVSMTFVASVAAILYCGAKPVLVDIDPKTGNINPEKIVEAITSKTKAILVVHLHGLMAEMDDILFIAKKNNLYVIEDAAQAHGAKYKEQPAGSLGDIGCFSFYPAKNLGACGEGGAVVTNHSHLAEKIFQLRHWGQSKKYQHDLAGFNYRMDEIQAAILNVKLKYLDHWINARKNCARLYDYFFEEMNIVHPVSISKQHAYHVYAIRIQNRDQIQKKLFENGIHTGIHYPIPVHLQKAYSESCSYSFLPHTEKFAKETLSLPLFSELSEKEIHFVCHTLTKILENQVFECMN